MGKVARYLGACLLACAMLSVAVAASAAVRFGQHDVRTVFYISKSDDRNRVDYGVRLDEHCQPVGGQPIYAYWHRFEPGQRRIGELNGMDRRAYGIQRQSVRSRSSRGSWIEMRIASVPDRRILVLARSDQDGCTAHAQVRLDGGDAILDRIHVQLGGPMSVDYVTIHGRDSATGQRITERRRPPAPSLIPGL